VKFAEQGLAGYGKPGNYFERQIGRWSKQYVASITQPIAEMDQLIEWLPAHMPASARDESLVSIVHGDYRLDNLMFHPTEPRVLAVLDWELSTLGHPLADFSYHCMAWHIPPGAFRGIGGLDLAAWASRPRTSTSACTASARGSPRPRPAADWNFYWPTTCSASPPSCKASPSGWRPAPPPARRPRPPARARGPWPSWPGSSPRAA
jgi:hypothetical protein